MKIIRTIGVVDGDQALIWAQYRPPGSVEVVRCQIDVLVLDLCRRIGQVRLTSTLNPIKELFLCRKCVSEYGSQLMPLGWFPDTTAGLLE